MFKVNLNYSSNKKYKKKAICFSKNYITKIKNSKLPNLYNLIL